MTSLQTTLGNHYVWLLTIYTRGFFFRPSWSSGGFTIALKLTSSAASPTIMEWDGLPYASCTQDGPHTSFAAQGSSYNILSNVPYMPQSGPTPMQGTSGQPQLSSQAAYTTLHIINSQEHSMNNCSLMSSNQPIHLQHCLSAILLYIQHHAPPAGSPRTRN